MTRDYAPRGLKNKRPLPFPSNKKNMICNLPRVSFSPESGGRVKPSRAMEDIRTQGTKTKILFRVAFVYLPRNFFQKSHFLYILQIIGLFEVNLIKS